MARDDAELDKETFDRVLAEELAKGTDRRIADGRARSAAIKAYRKAHGIQPAPPRTAGQAPAAAAAAIAEAGDGGAAPGQAPAAAVATATAGPTAVRTAPPPTGRVPEPKPGAGDKHRLLALVQPEGIQRVQREQGDRVNVYPHLLVEEFVAMMILLGFVVLYSTFVDAPLRELANPNLTPNPSKAPWYFLGLQELLRYFHPMIAGIIIPTLILVGLAAIPYVDRNLSTKPGDRKLAIMIFTMLFMFGATLTIFGSFDRGEGFNWVWPWSQGLFFEL
jgi:quinol---cytochrome c reductase cytochrome c subunit, bacillus type